MLIFEELHVFKAVPTFSFFIVKDILIHFPNIRTVKEILWFLDRGILTDGSVIARI